jgi:hypothetical protein
MFRVGRRCRISACVVLVTLAPALASAQDSPLRTPTIAASAAAAADWASTYYALKDFRLREVNPILRPMQGDPGRLISMGAMMDIGLVSAWNVGVGRDHPRAAVTGLWAMTAFRAYLALHNLRNTKRAERRAAVRSETAMLTPPAPASPGAAATCAGPATVPPCAAADRTARSGSSP